MFVSISISFHCALCIVHCACSMRIRLDCNSIHLFFNPKFHLHNHNSVYRLNCIRVNATKAAALMAIADSKIGLKDSFWDMIAFRMQKILKCEIRSKLRKTVAFDAFAINTSRWSSWVGMVCVFHRKNFNGAMVPLTFQQNTSEYWCHCTYCCFKNKQ